MASGSLLARLFLALGRLLRFWSAPGSLLSLLWLALGLLLVRFWFVIGLLLVC